MSTEAWEAPMMSTYDDGLIAEALIYGLDVEAERCDLDTLRDDLAGLRQMAPPLRNAVIAHMNAGWDFATAVSLAT